MSSGTGIVVDKYISYDSLFYSISIGYDIQINKIFVFINIQDLI
jgi:hypothetical protein